jgi:hypothetical protein
MIRKNFKRNVAISTVVAVMAIGLHPPEAKSNPAVLVAPAACATGVGCILIGTAIVGGALVYVWQNSQTGARYHTPVYHARPRKPKVVPGQMDIFGATVTTHEECKAMGGKQWKGDSSLGTKDGKLLGRCYK